MSTPEQPTPRPGPPPAQGTGDAGPTDGTGRGRDDSVRVVAVVVAAVAQVVGSPLGTALAGGRSVADVSERYATVVTPAGYAFAIWGVIFAGCLAWAVYQALPSQRERAVHRRVGWPLVVAFTANTLWEVVFPQDGPWVLVSLALIGLVVTASAVAVARLQGPDLTGLDRVLPGMVAPLLMGWVTIATVANVAIVGVYLGAPSDSALARAAGVVALIAAAAVVLDVSMRLRTSAGPFALAAGWGVLAVARAEPSLPVGLAAYAALAIILIGLLAQAWRTRRPLRVLLA